MCNCARAFKYKRAAEREACSIHPPHHWAGTVSFQPWSSWTGTRSGFRREEDSQSETLFRYAVFSRFYWRIPPCALWKRKEAQTTAPAWQPAKKSTGLLMSAVCIGIQCCYFDSFFLESLFCAWIESWYCEVCAGIQSQHIALCTELKSQEILVYSYLMLMLTECSVVFLPFCLMIVPIIIILFCTPCGRRITDFPQQYKRGIKTC